MTAVVKQTGLSSVEGIVSQLPIVSRGHFRFYFEELLAKAQRHFAAKHAHEEFLRHQAQGVIPTSINSLKTPVLQVSAEFKASPLKDAYEKIDTLTASFRRDMLQQFVAAKLQERDFYWATYLSPEAIETQLQRVYHAIQDGLFSTYKTTRVDELPQYVIVDLQQTEAIGPSLTAQVIEVARMRALTAQQRSKEKREKKAAADVQMSGADSGTANEKTLEKTVASVLKRREQSRRDKLRTGKQRGNILPVNLSFSELFTDLTTQSQELQGSEERPRRLHFKRKIIEETALILSGCKKRRVTGAGDCPKEFFASRLESRVLFLQMKCQVTVLRTLRLTNFGVHTAPDVSIPRNIEYFLAVNLKYIFPKLTSFSLPRSSFENVSLQLFKWLYFRDKEPSDRLPMYLAQDVEPEMDFPDDDARLQAAVRAGRDMILSQVEAVVPRSTRRPEPEPYLSELGVTVKALQEFMLLNRYMAFITDKNLGIAVVKKDWYEQEVLSHLSLDVYLRLPEVPWDDLLDEYGSLVLELPDEVSPKLRAFLSEPRHVGKVPHFHAIPKIHKDPWKIRPIVPMHSFFTTRLAMVVHYYLHPLVATFPWVCQSSRSFVRDLLLRTRGRKCTWRMFTGDVRSMYTNIGTAALLQALWEVLKEAGFSPSLGSFLLRAVEFLNGSVFFHFNQQVFQQQYGIAMGLACGPTLANLFMAVWERAINVEERFQFYRRYIDDVFALTLGEDPTDLVQVPGLILDWESKDNIPFLDCEVHLHGDEVCVRPYAKQLSHYQYLPWNSGHPVHVKRGLVKTELLRMSSLSAKAWYFDERKERLHTLLRARGYPERALKAWMRQVQWRDPASVAPPPRQREAAKAPLFAPSEYNPVWEQVKLGPVWDQVLREMVTWRDKDLPPFSGLTASLQRTTNLWDVVRRVNRKMFQLDITEGQPDQALVHQTTD